MLASKETQILFLNMHRYMWLAFVRFTKIKIDQICQPALLVYTHQVQLVLSLYRYCKEKLPRKYKVINKEGPWPYAEEGQSQQGK